MQPLGDGLFEPVVYKGFPLAAELWPDADSLNPYRTNDLFVEEPPGSGLFVLQGRKDDLLVHSNGEKTNALPLQMALDSCPLIHKAAVFGHGRPCTAALIQPSRQLTTEREREELLNAVEQCCLSFATHTRIPRSMVYILDAEATLPVTPKGSVRRKEVERLYGEQLAALYDRLEGGDVVECNDPTQDNLSDLEYIARCAQEVLGLGVTIAHDANFYRLGLDSQKAVRLRSSLMKRFGKFPLLFVFEYPSVALLEKVLSEGAKANTGGWEGSRAAEHHQWMRDAVDRYADEIRTWQRLRPVSPRAKAGDVVYLTGATGALGNALIEAFVANPEVRKVYCAIRGGSDRMKAALRDRGYPQDVVGSSKLDAVPYTMSDPQLGLDEALYARLSGEVTIVLHNAWKMDFNTPVHEFDHDCLQGTMHLLRFANTGQSKTFVFPSSVAAHLGSAAAGKVIAETEAVNDPSLALDTGYAQSKLAVEIILQSAARHLVMPVDVLRIGQLSGHSVLGAWNDSEMFPIMIVTGLKHLNAMPVLSGEDVDWLPVDSCARSINNLLRLPQKCHKEKDKCSVHNLVNPQTISWTSFLDVLEEASGKPFDRLSMSDWVAKLQKACDSDNSIPGTRLLGFFEDMATQSHARRPTFSTAETQLLIPALAETRAMDSSLLRLYLDRWKSSGFL